MKPKLLIVCAVLAVLSGGVHSRALNGKFSQGVDASSISPSPAVQVPTPFGIDPTPTVKYPQATRTAEVPSQLDGNVIADKPTDRFQHGDNHVNPNDVDKSFHRRDVEELPDWIDDESSGEDFPSSDASILSENLATDEGYDSEYDEESSTHLPRMDMDQPDTVLPDYSSADDVDGSTAQDDDQSVEDDQFQEGDQFLDDVQPLDDDQSLEDEQFPEEDQSLNNDQFHEENQEDGTDDEGFDSGDEEDSLTSEEEEADEQPATSLPTIITELVNKYVYGGDNNVDEFSEEQATSFPTRITEMFSEYLNLGRKTDSSNAGKEDLGQEEETIPFPTRVANLVNKYLKSGVETEDRPTRVTEIMNSLYRGRNKPDSSNNDHKRAPATAFPTRVKELLNEYLYSGGNRGKSLDGENQGTVREEQATAFPTRVTELFNKYLYTGRDDSLDAGGEEQTTMFPTRVTEVVNKFFYPGESPTQATKGYAFPTIVTKLYNNVHKFFKGFSRDLSQVKNSEVNPKFRHRLQKRDLDISQGIPGEELHSATLSSEEQWKHAKKGESIRPSDEQLPSIGGGLDPSFGSSHHEFRRSLMGDDLGERRSGSSLTGSEGGIDELHSSVSTVEDTIREAPIGTSDARGYAGKHMEAKPHKKYDRIINGKKKRFGLLPTEENFIFNEDGSVTPKPGYSLGKKGYVGDISKLPGMDSDEHFQIDVDDDEPDELDEYIPGHISPSSEEQWKRAKKGESIRPSDEQLPSIGGGLDPSFGSSHREFRRSLNMDDLSEGRAGSSRTGSEGVMDDLDSTMSNVENNIREAPLGTSEARGNAGKHIEDERDYVTSPPRVDEDINLHSSKTAEPQYKGKREESLMQPEDLTETNTPEYFATMGDTREGRTKRRKRAIYNHHTASKRKQDEAAGDSQCANALIGGFTIFCFWVMFLLVLFLSLFTIQTHFHLWQHLQQWRRKKKSGRVNFDLESGVQDDEVTIFQKKERCPTGYPKPSSDAPLTEICVQKSTARATRPQVKQPAVLIEVPNKSQFVDVQEGFNYSKKDRRSSEKRRVIQRVTSQPGSQGLLSSLSFAKSVIFEGDEAKKKNQKASEKVKVIQGNTTRDTRRHSMVDDLQYARSVILEEKVDKAHDRKASENRKIVRRNTGDSKGRRFSMAEDLAYACSVIVPHEEDKTRDHHASEKRRVIKKETSRRHSLLEGVEFAHSVIIPDQHVQQLDKKAADRRDKIQHTPSTNKRQQSMQDHIERARSIVLSEQASASSSEQLKSRRSNKNRRSRHSRSRDSGESSTSSA
ncbi:uncharacterized protein LOC116610250 isoform X3 [Nematostella vectensis]|uniref:uncharacterized protein LOC116610250 isoform X3 n=1 Tax=Nematostella vectensis TaxID=45351 RepID=UPI0020775AA5|nr:uncharacterized protein LOC116610250 isoform X3 [Nematostella vectensis]